MTPVTSAANIETHVNPLSATPGAVSKQEVKAPVVIEQLHNLWATGLKLPPKVETNPAEDQLGLQGVERFFAQFLDDRWSIRKFTALGNEIAESTKETFFNWLPKPLATLVYRALWAMAFACTGIRTIMKARLAPDAIKTQAACKLLAQDMVSTIIGPTIVANIANWTQDKLYTLLHIPQQLIDIIRPIGSLTACNVAIDALDPQGIKFGEYLTGLKADQEQHTMQDTPILTF